MSIKSKLGAGAIGLCTLYASSVFAVAALTGPPVIDTTTHGSWMDTYGSCYNVLPQASPRILIPEIEIGPNFVSTNPEQYQNPPAGDFVDVLCIGGDATDNFDVRIYSQAPPTDQPGSLQDHAYAWGFNEPGQGAFDVAPGTSQQNACQGEPYASTFDSDKYAFDPLSGEIKVVLGGDAKIAYYFLSEADICRSQAYELKVNGTPVPGGAGTVDDISLGKYVVFDLIDIPDGATITLDVTIADPTCASASGLAYNSHMSGIFVDGTNACLDPFCGDGNVDPDETCDPPGSDISPDPSTGPQMCTDSCNYCGDGFTDRQYEACDPTNPSDPNAKMCSNSCEIREAPSRTLGYWKTHPTVINGDFGGAPSLLPLEFCGKQIADACDAVYFLSKGGGGIRKFKRQGMAALLNCTAFGCPTKISNLITEGSAACATKDPNYKFGKTGGKLGYFNEANKDLPLPFKSPSALPKYCK